MARKKKDAEEILDEELELDEDTFGDDEDEEEVDEDEDEDEEDESKTEPTGEISIEVDEEVVAKEPPGKAPRKRAAKVAVAEAKPVETPVAAAAPVVVEAPKDPAVAQWEAAQKTAAAISANLENVHAMLKDLPEHYATALQKLVKQQTPKPAAGAKLAFAMSAMAIVLSVLSLSFSQTARQLVLTRHAGVPAVHSVPAPERTKIESAATTKGGDLDVLAALDADRKLKPRKTKKSKSQ